MICPQCQREALVTDTRPTPGSTRRRRYACACGIRFTTHESIVSIGDARLAKQHPFVSTLEKQRREALRTELTETIDRILNA